MIINATEKGILSRWRNKNNEVESHFDSYNVYKPRFYIEDDVAEVADMLVTDNLGKYRIKLNYEANHFSNRYNLDGKPLKEVTWTPSKPSLSKVVRSFFENRGDITYEADVPLHHRWCVDRYSNADFPEYEMRKWYWDMEWMTVGEHEGAITCIVVYDNYDRRYVTYHWQPEMETFLEQGYDVPTNRLYVSEQKMLQAFLNDLIEKDPDMLISWFGWKFDLPKLIERMIHNEIDARLLSPINEVSGVYWKDDAVTYSKRKVNSYSAVYQPIAGRICVPLDMAFERQWMDSQRGTLPSMALDYISEEVLGDKKLVSEKFPDKNDFFARAWLEEADTYLKYAKKDVELLVRIDEMNHTVDAIVALQRLLRAPFDACFHASKMGNIYFMRNAYWKPPTGQRGDRVSYDGAMVYDPLSEGTNGLHLGVAAFDFAGLYPSMIIARNISWESRSEEPTKLGVNLRTPKDFSKVSVEDMRYFKTDELGVLPRALINLKGLRNDYKKKMKEATDEDEYTKWNNNQLAVKRLMASFYGIIAFQGFGWADVDLAACITASAREAIREAASVVRELE